MSGLCTHREGWGPLSPDRYDLTPCFEYSVFFGAIGAVAIAGFLARTRYLRHRAKPHGLGRTAWIYWPTQIFMVAAAIAIWTLAYQFFTMKDSPTVFAWSCIIMGIAWVAAVILNKYEHIYEIRSSSAIFAFYAISIGGTLVILMTARDSGSGTNYSLVALIAFTLALTAGFVVEAWPRGNTRVQRSSNAGMYDKANLLSRLTFWFFTPIISIGLKRTITADDTSGQLPESLAAYTGHKHLSRAWDQALRRHGRSSSSSSSSSKETPPSLFWTVLKNGWEMLIPVLLSRIAIVLFSYTLPVLLKELLNYLEEYESKPVSYGITLALGMFTASLFVSLLSTYNRYQMLILGIASRSALISMIYRKSLRLSAGSRNEASSGKITNHMSVDADQWWNAIMYISMWIEIPLALSLSIKMLNPLDPVISVEDASFSWASPSNFESQPDPGEPRTPLAEKDGSASTSVLTLQSIQLTVQRGSLTAVVGRVGQGKSSLLSAMIGDMYKLKGQVELHGRVAYVPQQAWICNATLKDNILFGNGYDEAKYRHVLFACGLEPDIAMLPGGDMTEIGERGINLSGGQKQRVSLARAAYDDADVYFLDDPLSAVDAHVDHHLWENLIGPSGLLKSKARILVTHGTHHLHKMDQIVVIKDGFIQERGDYSHLMSSKKDFYRLMKEYTILERRMPHGTIKRRQSRDDTADDVSFSRGESDSEGPSTEEDDVTEQDTSGDEAKGPSEPFQKQETEKQNTKAVLIGAEKMKEGGVGFDVVLHYAKEA
ncbi:hypothetical protein BGZ97_000667 [Linnemannia gamsii]|uniref:P-loop containing nucleoside triphosphate hydrolase protein n=1 Tax=Linnemannia gamsii TaxID=64522 RepID=A0A9P6R2N9_9FUNG|nr:hypothetical protein BGZ97_000667 [Linnemannia gamsii]